MGSTRRDKVVVGLLVCLPATVLLGTVPAVAWRLTGPQHAPHLDARVDQVWPDAAPAMPGTAPVRITGTVDDPFSPGVSVPVNVTLLNPNPRAVTIRRVRFRISQIVAPRADATHPCTLLDFEVRQMPRRLLLLPAGRSTGLAALGLPTWSWPRLAMRNRPLNQDGCKGARLTLEYHATRFRQAHR